MIQLTKQQARNYLTNRSFLHEKAGSIIEVLKKFRCIQVDPIGTYGKSHELALWNRVERLKRYDLENELYKNKNLFEYWLQLYSIIPTEYYPYLKPAMNKKLGDWRADYYKNHKKQIKQVLEYLDHNSSITAKDLSYIAAGESVFDWKGKTSQKAFLEYLWDIGEVMITNRKSNHKLYDLTKDVLPEDILSKKITINESIKFHLESSFHYIGLLRQSFLTRHRSFLSKEIRALFAKYQKQNKVIRVEVEGSKNKYFILKEQLGELEKCKNENLHESLNILPPLDPLVIDRELINDIFDFFYRWEAYVPEAKRKFGYYGMPILYKGELVGQVRLEKIKNYELKIKNLATKVDSVEFKEALKERVVNLEKFLVS
jgi:uncharacterized protein YcaQ